MKRKTIIITSNSLDHEVQILTNELKNRDFIVKHFIPKRFIANVSDFKEEFRQINPKIGLVRGIGIAPTQKIFYRLDLLSAIEKIGIRLVNSRESLEIASDKFLSSLYLKMNNIATPKTFVCENNLDAMNAFEELGGDVILKPLYGSKGIGITRLNDKGFAENVINTLYQLNKVFYLQEFIEHNNQDIRILVLGDQAIAGMYRINNCWKTNIHAGAKMKPLKLTEELRELAIRSAHAVKTEIAGVDIMESNKGYQVIEVNSTPGFTALQKVSNKNLSKEIIEYFLNST
ncbi:MAG: RimK family alpha-L-glutamate ligase [Candidatus Lokiarchaeota archaeon]|nr:RimK family alpha-L-glutamate ligase [Candidatus Lokiarchaeota archaeon]